MRTSTLLLTAIFAVASTVYAQTASPPGQHRLSTDLLSVYWGRNLLTSEANVHYSYRPADRWEYFARAAYSGRNLFARPTNLPEGQRLRDQLGVRGYAFGVGAQYHLGESTRHRRWFIGPELNFTHTHYEERVGERRDFTLRKLTASLVAGQRYLLDALELEWFVGCGASFRNFGWQKQAAEQASTPSREGSFLDASSSVTFGLVEEPSIGIAIPVGVRLGWRF